MTTFGIVRMRRWTSRMCRRPARAGVDLLAALGGGSLGVRALDLVTVAVAASRPSWSPPEQKE